MNKRFFVSVAVTFVMLMGFGFLVHGVLLAHDYSLVPNLFRTEEDQTHHFPFMLLAHALTAFAFVWVYSRGKENGPALAQGFRFGLAMAVLMVVAKFLVYYAVQPMPHVTALKQIVFDTVAVVIMGIVVAHLNK